MRAIQCDHDPLSLLAYFLVNMAVSQHIITLYVVLRTVLTYLIVFASTVRLVKINIYFKFQQHLKRYPAVVDQLLGNLLGTRREHNLVLSATVERVMSLGKQVI
jgi:hypothetical protein